jgi:hypothetical protein
MPVNHPNAKKAYIVHEGPFAGPWRMVLVIETDLHTNSQHEQFDFEALTALRKAGEAYVAAHDRLVDDFRIIPMNDPI